MIFAAVCLALACASPRPPTLFERLVLATRVATVRVVRARP